MVDSWFSHCTGNMLHVINVIHMSIVFPFYILGLTPWIWTNPSIERLEFESPSKWNSYEGFNLQHCTRPCSINIVIFHVIAPHTPCFQESTCAFPSTTCTICMGASPKRNYVCNEELVMEVLWIAKITHSRSSFPRFLLLKLSDQFSSYCCLHTHTHLQYLQQ
jgi:hypothetical protein